MRPLIADGGQVTFLRDLAAYSWGKWAVEWPETVPEDQRPKPTQDDRDFGYVAKLGRNLGRMGRRFTRSDVSITAAEYTPEGNPIQYSGLSDVEDVLDAAQKRVGSDVFIERDITRAGLNGNVPYVDFDVDDVVPVLIWGKTLNLPVTSIQEVTQEGAVIDWQIHVGGELISNDLARERANQDIERAIALERRERQDAVSNVDSKASSAVSTADSANAKSDQALEATSETRSYVDEQLADVRSSIADSGVYLENVKAYVAEGRQHAESAAAMAAQAGELATRAEQIYASMDPLRDDVESIHAEVSRLGLLAAGHAQQAAEEAALGKQYVESAKAYAQQALEQAQAGEQHVNDAGVQATAAQEYAARAQQIVGDAQAVLDGTNADAQAAKKALEDAGKLLNDVDGKGTSLPEALAQVVTMHQEVLETHSDILDAHRDVLEKHGQAIRWAAMAASQASAAAQSASQAAQDALRASSEAAKAADDAATAAGHANRAAEENAAAIVTLGQADEKLKEADRKLQAQIDETRKAGELLAQAVKILSAGVAANSAASQSALMAADENRKATQATNLAVETLTEVQKETSRQAATAEQVSKDAVSTANLVAEQQAAYEALSDERNALQDSNIEMLADLQKEQLRALGDVFIIGGDTNVRSDTVSNAYFSKDGSSDYLTALGSWAGRIIFTSYRQATSIDPALTGMYEVPVPLPDGSRRINLENYTPAATTLDTDWMQVQYWVNPAVQYRSEETGGSFTATQNAWTTIGTHTISRSNQLDNFVGSWRVFWGAANRGSTYGIRIVTSSGTVLKERTTTKLGPLTSLGNGRWSMYTQVSGVDVPAGQDVYFQVYCSHSGTSQRGIYKSESSASWLEEN
ncbi:hypothetical protein NQ028_06530 [Corynebacterium phoceense]|uniref:hypothetical protein n=1 Tax=Corynebacterium phoceense TaxID=1686286 RepID=UPI00211CD106|nr:hypothetical protein [Corynebacterium phoceense]MCQ9340801.1 hypothetical protein [Corynebacterium phoceense]